jgi:ADP-dependent NAD(P)H-hydrate dehydratase / NAD(P)H-hydrate epimerase
MIKSHVMQIGSRKEDSHKGDYGKVLVVAGSRGMTGSACLCSLGALRSGSGLVTCAVPETLSDIMETKLTEVMTLSLPAGADGSAFAARAVKGMLEFSEGCDVVAIGPGLGESAAILKIVNELVEKVSCPIVIDADGLNVISGKMEVVKKRKAATVITPHPGEAGRILGEDTSSIQQNRVDAAKRLFEISGAVVCLKGHKTIVVGPQGDLFVNDTGNSGMGTAGTGDILTGMIASFIGQGLDPYGAAVSGVYLHGLAGDIASQKKGVFSMIASDILDSLHEAFTRSGL